MSAIQALLESAEGQSFLESNAELLQEAEIVTNDFRKVMKAFVLQNPDEFLGATLEETAKNIRVFSEVGTAQFLNEISSLYGSVAHESFAVTEGTLNDYL